MDKEKESARINLEFLRTNSPSKQDKIKDFWKYLDKQDVLKPYQCPKFTEDPKPREGPSPKSRPKSSPSSNSKITNMNSTKTGTVCNPKKEPTQNKSKSSNGRLEKMFKMGCKLAYTIEPTYEEINAEIREYENRLKSMSKEEESSDSESDEDISEQKIPEETNSCKNLTPKSEIKSLSSPNSEMKNTIPVKTKIELKAKKVSEQKKTKSTGSGLEKMFKMGCKLADTVEPTYEEINAEIREYENRLKSMSKDEESSDTDSDEDIPQ